MWYLINRNERGTPSILTRYSDTGYARRGMRVANRNAGWTRITRCQSGYADMEWCAKSNGLPVYDYGPYVVMHKHYYDQKYGVNHV